MANIERIYPFPKNSYWELPSVHTTAVSDHVIGMLESGLSHAEFVVLAVLLQMIGNRNCCKELSSEDVMRACGISSRKRFYKTRKGLKEKNLIRFTDCVNRGGVCIYEIMHPEIPGRSLPSKDAPDYKTLPNWVVWQFYSRSIPEDKHTSDPFAFECPISSHAGTGTFHIRINRDEDYHGHWECKECVAGRSPSAIKNEDGESRGWEIKWGQFGGMQYFYQRAFRVSDHEAAAKVRGIVHEIFQEYHEYIREHHEEPSMPVFMPEGFVRPPAVLDNGETAF